MGQKSTDELLIDIIFNSPRRR